GELLDQETADAMRVLDSRGHRGHEGRRRVREADALERRAQALRRALDERAVEGTADPELHRLPRPTGRGLLDQPVHGRVLAGDAHLARAVVVRGPHVVEAGAELLDYGVLESQNSRHRTGMPVGGLSHRTPAL